VVELVKVERGLYAIKGTRWTIGRTDDLYEGPRGGSSRGSYAVGRRTAAGSSSTSHRTSALCAKLARG
jgi:hypothetical protein